MTNWETITKTNGVPTTERLVVPGGWLYRTTIWSTEDRANGSLRRIQCHVTFVPKPMMVEVLAADHRGITNE